MLISWFLRRLVPRHENRRANRDQQNRHDYDKREVIRNRKRLGQDHFNSNKNEDDGEANPKINKPIHQIGQQEVEGTQPKNGADVRGVNNERVLRDGENSRNGIDRENEVHHVNHKQDQGKRR